MQRAAVGVGQNDIGSRKMTQRVGNSIEMLTGVDIATNKFSRERIIRGRKPQCCKSIDPSGRHRVISLWE